MADTQRTKAAILALFADNTTGQISEQDLRDFVVTVMESEFINPGDFFNLPLADSLTSDRVTKGWHLYSQVMLSACSFGDVLYLSPNNTWGTADVSQSARVGFLGMAAESYAAADSQCKILMRGILMLSSLSGRLSDKIGRPLYLLSGASGQFSITADTNVLKVGVVLPGGVGSTQSSGKIFFDPEWAVVGA